MDIFYKDKIGVAVLIALFLGLRRSEVVALKWSDINLNIINIQRTAIHIKENGKDTVHIQNKVKNEASARKLQISDYLLFYLKLEKQRQIENKRNQKEYNYQYDGYICVDNKGNLITPNYISRRFRRIQKINNILFPIRYHDLRHTCATILYSQGASDMDVQKWLGHANIATTAKIYVHLSKIKSNNIAKSINDYMANVLRIN